MLILLEYFLYSEEVQINNENQISFKCLVFFFLVNFSFCIWVDGGLNHSRQKGPKRNRWCWTLLRAFLQFCGVQCNAVFYQRCRNMRLCNQWSCKIWFASVKSKIRKEKYCSATPMYVCTYVTLRVPPLDSETGWSGKLWLNTIILKLENEGDSISFFFFQQN